ncbi:MAG: hypothetical protein C3F11_09850, partial [Methylocystaceae bacterium]
SQKATVMLQLPQGPEGIDRVGKRAADEVSKSEPRRVAAVGQYSDEILQVPNPRDFIPGERFLEWQFPLHTGEAFGDAGRAFICIFGFVPALLFVAGALPWRRKPECGERRPLPRGRASTSSVLDDESQRKCVASKRFPRATRSRVLSLKSPRQFLFLSAAFDRLCVVRPEAVNERTIRPGSSEKRPNPHSARARM